jgi:hypothetical protein
VTKGLGFLSDENDEDFERMTHHYKDPNGGDADRHALIKSTKVTSHLVGGHAT